MYVLMKPPALLRLSKYMKGEYLANGKAMQLVHTAQSFAICLLCMSGVLALS